MALPEPMIPLIGGPDCGSSEGTCEGRGFGLGTLPDCASPRSSWDRATCVLAESIHCPLIGSNISSGESVTGPSKPDSRGFQLAAENTLPGPRLAASCAATLAL